MRFIKAPIPRYYEDMMGKVIPQFKIGQDLQREFFSDLLFVIAQGYDGMFRYLCSVEDIYNESAALYQIGAVKNMRVFEDEQYKLRLDLIDFADSQFARLIRKEPSMKLEEKFMFVMMILDQMYQQRRKNNGAAAAMDPNSPAQQGASQSSTQNGVPAKAQMTSSFFKGFSFLTDMLADGLQRNPGETGAARGGSPLEDMYKEAMNGKLSIAGLVDSFYSNKLLEIYHIAKNLDISFSRSHTGVLENTDGVASNITTAKMHHMKDIHKAIRSELAMDEDILDRKIMTKSLQVMKFRERREQKQCLYALLDGSGSMDEQYCGGVQRIMFVKAIAIALGKKTLREGGKFFFRWFRGYVKDMYCLEHQKQWPQFLSYILNEKPVGGTDVDLALHAAVNDIRGEVRKSDKSDMIVLTDGTQDITDPSEFLDMKGKGLKFHFVFLEDLSNSKNVEKVANTFQLLDLQNLSTLDDFEPEFRKVV